MIEVDRISKAYGRRQVLSQISFHIEAGQCVGIAGANGCGKSTLLAILAGAMKPDGGKILYQGKPVDNGRYRRETGYVPQGNPLLEELTVQDNLKLWYKGTGAGAAVKNGRRKAVRRHEAASEPGLRPG